MLWGRWSLCGCGQGHVWRGLGRGRLSSWLVRAAGTNLAVLSLGSFPADHSDRLLPVRDHCRRNSLFSVGPRVDGPAGAGPTPIRVLPGPLLLACPFTLFYPPSCAPPVPTPTRAIAGCIRPS